MQRDITEEERYELLQAALSNASLCLVRAGIEPKNLPEPPRTAEELRAVRRVAMRFIVQVFQSGQEDGFGADTYGGHA